MRPEFLQRLTAFFSEFKEVPHVELAYLFGSHAAGKEGPMSDFDIAVLYSSNPLPEQTYRMAHQLASLLKNHRIDLVVLNRAPIELRYAVIANGCLVHEADVSVRVEFEAQTLSRYGDFLPVLRKQRKDILKERKDETGIQRNRAALGQTEHLLEKIRTL
jgi:uncharacterized protein